MLHSRFYSCPSTANLCISPDAETETRPDDVGLTRSDEALWLL